MLAIDAMTTKALSTNFVMASSSPAPDRFRHATSPPNERSGHATLCRHRMAAGWKTFVTQAVLNPDAAMPSAARIAAPPAPTITTS